MKTPAYQNITNLVLWKTQTMKIASVARQKPLMNFLSFKQQVLWSSDCSFHYDISGRGRTWTNVCKNVDRPMANNLNLIFKSKHLLLWRKHLRTLTKTSDFIPTHKRRRIIKYLIVDILESTRRWWQSRDCFHLRWKKRTLHVRNLGQGSSKHAPCSLVDCCSKLSANCARL